MTYAIIQEAPDSTEGLTFYGGAREFWRYRGHEAVLSGAYETGKTLAALTKFHTLLCKYPHSRGLMVRETYNSLIQSAVVTYEQKVLPFPPGHLHCGVTKFGGERPEFYDYPNHSRIVLTGLDKADKVLSAEYDFIYINQLEELTLDQYEKLVGRASGRAGNAPYPQVMADCNPGPPTHWILNRKPLKLFEQRHEHNPRLFDQATGQITEQGKIAMSVLDAMTGIRYQRGRLGLWVAAEGVIYDNLLVGDDGNITDKAEFNPAWDVMWGVDDGYVEGQGPGTESHHPRVILLAQITPTGSVHIFQEYYQTGVASYQTTIQEVAEMGYPKPEIAYIDKSAAMFKGALQGAGIYTIAPKSMKSVAEGIKNVRELICDGNLVRRILIHTRCKNLIREMLSYRYSTSLASVNGEPKPMKLDDHGPDALRYMTWQLRNQS